MAERPQESVHPRQEYIFGIVDKLKDDGIVHPANTVLARDYGVKFAIAIEGVEVPGINWSDATEEELGDFKKTYKEARQTLSATALKVIEVAVIRSIIQELRAENETDGPIGEKQ